MAFFLGKNGLYKGTVGSVFITIHWKQMQLAIDLFHLQNVLSPVISLLYRPPILVAPDRLEASPY
jgi:hypothetical protein